jgi:signal transduction histidine kinase
MTWAAKYRGVSERWLLLAMLLTLHIAVWTGISSIWASPFLFAHLGLFLLWQPLWRGEEKLSTRNALVIVGASVMAMVWLSWWVLAFWVSGLFALVGGRVFAFQSMRQRLRYLLVMGYLLGVLLIWLTPQLFVLPTTVDATKGLMEIGLPFLLLGMVLVPHESERLPKTQAIDVIYSLLLFLLLILLVLGSLAFMYLGHAEYFEALLRTLFMMALVLFVLGWLWDPRLGFSGFHTLFSRFFLNIGSPFELWVKHLALAAQKETSPAAFMDSATEYLAALPWFSGLTWASDDNSGQKGKSSAYFIELADQDLHLKLFMQQRSAPTVLMHIHLLTQMLAHFYQAKRREQQLRELVHLQAVHETGARLTHDLKNMLQYLLAMISVAEQQPNQTPKIMQQQLPVLAQRIQLALGKLTLRKSEADATMMPLANWWHTLQQRQQYRDLVWLAEDNISERLIPLALFDSIVDNLIENARNKRLSEPGIKVEVKLTSQPLSLIVCDSGRQIPQDMADQLLRTVVDSESGLGIGLFQAARWAEQLGYRLALRENLSTRVCFELTELIEQ